MSVLDISYTIIFDDEKNINNNGNCFNHYFFDWIRRK